MTISNIIHSVAIIGAGPSGLALANALKTEGIFSKIKMFERQPQVGGVWNYSDETRNTPLIPSTSPFEKEPTLVKNGKPMYYSPMYKTLETNIPKDVMAFNNNPFNKEYEIFPTREQVLQYLQDYSKNVNELVQYNTEVLDVKKDNGVWEITSTNYNTETPTSEIEQFDAVAICTGHYDLPYIPQVSGIAAWSAKFPGHILHSKYYNDPSDYKDQTILVIGNSASGLDVSMQTADYATKVYRSISSASRMPYAEDPRITDVPKIREFLPEEGKIVLEDDSILENIDKIIYCTGYLYSFPFLNTYNDGQHADSVLTKGDRINRLYKQIFYIPDPTLVFINMTKFTIPFPLAESQGTVAAAVFSGRITLPDDSTMRECERAEEAEKGNVNAEFHSIVFPKDIEYYRELQAWLNTATDPSVGFKPVVWDDARYELRAGAFDKKRLRLENKISQKLGK